MYSGSFGSLVRAPVVVWLVSVRLVHSGAPRRSSGSLGFVWLILTRPCVVGFIRDRLVNESVPRGSSGSLGQGSSGSFAFVWFILTRHGGRRVIMVCGGSRRVHWGSFASSGRIPGLVGFIHVRLVHSGAPRKSSFSFASLERNPGVVGFIGERPRVNSGWFGSFNCSTAVVGFIRVGLVHSDTPRVSSGSF